MAENARLQRSTAIGLRHGVSGSHTATGFVMDFGGPEEFVPGLVTCKHVVEEGRPIYFDDPRTGEVQNLDARRAILHPHQDLSAIRLNPEWILRNWLPRPVLSLADLSEGVRPRQAVEVAGYPRGMTAYNAETPTLRTGPVVVAPASAYADFAVVASLAPGSSGSPVFEANTLNLVGIVHGGRHEDDSRASGQTPVVTFCTGAWRLVDLARAMGA